MSYHTKKSPMYLCTTSTERVERIKDLHRPIGIKPITSWGDRQCTSMMFPSKKLLKPDMAAPATSTSIHYFLSPMTRKKKVPDAIQANTYRVISEDAENGQPSRSVRLPDIAQCNVIGQEEPGKPDQVTRRHKPNPSNVGFLLQNVRSMQDRVCWVGKEDHSRHWMMHGPEEVKKVPPYTYDTTARSEYQWRANETVVKYRQHKEYDLHHQGKPTHGIVPVTLLGDDIGKQQFWKERISYEHELDSRSHMGHHQRGKRHGCFIWDKISPEKAVEHLPPMEAQEFLQDYYKTENSVKKTTNIPLTSAITDINSTNPINLQLKGSSAPVREQHNTSKGSSAHMPPVREQQPTSKVRFQEPHSGSLPKLNVAGAMPTTENDRLTRTPSLPSTQIYAV